MTGLNTPHAHATSKATPFESALGLQPKLLEKYRHFMAQLWQNDTLTHRTLDLCRLQIATIHGCRAELAWRTPAGGVTDAELQALTEQNLRAFTPQEQLALAVAELVPQQHHSVSDEQVHQLQLAFGDAGCVALLTACAFFDVNCRLQLSLAVAPPHDSAQAPLLQGSRL